SKIRQCMNIQGQVEQLPLFEPPINPGLLVRAAAAGVDLDSVLSDLGTPLPYYRFQVMAQKATELLGEVRSLGQSLLAALEKQDAESLTLLRANQELVVLRSTLDAKQQAVNEANASIAALTQSQSIATLRQQYYAGLYQGGLTQSEKDELSKLGDANNAQQQAGKMRLVAAALAAGPGGSLGFAGAGGSPQGNISFSGQQLAWPFEFRALQLESQATQSTFESRRAGINATEQRRSAEWQFQMQSASMDVAQIASQIQAANFRLQIAQDDFNTLQLQIQNATAITTFLQNKYTSVQLYSWMVSQLSATYFQVYQVAYELAKRAETAFHQEIGDAADPRAVSYIQFGYWDSLKKGLLAGEKMAYDLKRMEVAYLEQNRRELEVTKHVSLLEFDPAALAVLRATGQCFLYLPETLFDADFPGHYMRRIKSLGVTVPCEVGPYTSVNCTLTLVRHATRWNPTTAGWTAVDFTKTSDPNVLYNLAALESIVTSSAQTDAGLFEVNLRDERYLPFEGAGAVALWMVQLPLDTNAFDT
ncbi:MAG: neuraminidase-like domain-containing protein, partial [Nitrososphaerales archaeon]